MTLQSMRRRVLHAVTQPLAYSSGPSSSPKSFPAGDQYRPAPASDRKFLLFALCSLVFPLVPQLILISIKRLQKQQGELHGAEIIAAGVVVLQFLQFILHRLRFRRSHWLVQWGAWAAYYLPVPLAALAVGMMLRLRQPFWPAAILFAAGQSDTMAAYSLDDDSQNMRRFAKRTLYLAYLIVALMQQVAPSELYPLLAASFLVLFVHLKVVGTASIPSGDICMVAAEGGTTGAPSTSRAPGAVVAVGSLESRWSAVSGSTTYEDILGLIDYSAKWKDLCLSSAFFLQLLKRYHTPHQRIDNSSAVNLVFKELLAGEKSRDYARALELVKVQLSLMYDHFFSVHGSPSSASYKLYWDHWVFKIGFLMHALSSVYPKAVSQRADQHGTFAVGVIYLLVLLELCQLAHYLTSDRFVVSYLCDRVRVLSSRRSSRSKPRHMVVLDALLETRDTSWQNTLGQYSLLEDFDCASLGQRLMGRLHLHGRPQRGTHASPVTLSMDEVKGWILGKVLASELSGSSSTTTSASETTSPSQRRTKLPRQLSWALSQETETHTILTWHIATWLCAMRDVNEVLPSSDYMAATKLSSYCAYLVAFHPEFLPGHRAAAARIFDEAAREAEHHLKGEKSSYGRYTRFMSSWEQNKLFPQGVLKRGAMLARQLTGMDKSGSSDCWTVMADFWADMLLHLALSGSATAHIEHLAKGGQFVTHLWALVSNAGMQQQDSTLIKRKRIDSNVVKNKQASTKVKKKFLSSTAWDHVAASNFHSSAKMQFTLPTSRPATNLTLENPFEELITTPVPATVTASGSATSKNRKLPLKPNVILVENEDLRRSFRVKNQSKSFKKNSCSAKNCLACSAGNPPSTVSPSLVKNMGATFCNMNAYEVFDEALLAKKKTTKRAVKKPTKKDSTEVTSSSKVKVKYSSKCRKAKQPEQDDAPN
jgi:hypothetical protein